MNRQELLAQRLDGSLAAIGTLRGQIDQIDAAAQTILTCFSNGGTLFTCGNGGSAAQALHLAEELIGRYRSSRKPMAAVCLNSDPTALTCIANDFGFDQVFSRPCEALLKPGDVLLVLSTSGKSGNILRALEVASSRGVQSIGLLGKDGGAAARLCSTAIVVASNDSAYIQDAHQVIIHMLCETVESA